MLFMVPSGSSHVTMVEEKQLEGWSSPANPAFVVTLPQSMTSAPRGALDEMKVVDILPFLKERETWGAHSEAGHHAVWYAMAASRASVPVHGRSAGDRTRRRADARGIVAQLEPISRPR